MNDKPYLQQLAELIGAEMHDSGANGRKVKANPKKRSVAIRLRQGDVSHNIHMELRDADADVLIVGGPELVRSIASVLNRVMEELLRDPVSGKTPTVVSSPVWRVDVSNGSSYDSASIPANGAVVDDYYQSDDDED